MPDGSCRRRGGFTGMVSGRRPTRSTRRFGAPWDDTPTRFSKVTHVTNVTDAVGCGFEWCFVEYTELTNGHAHPLTAPFVNNDLLTLLGCKPQKRPSVTFVAFVT